MVELKLEHIEDALAKVPSDCYISVRVGDTQKLSKLSNARIYRFPALGDQRLGKIEVFQRIGQCSIDVDPLNTGTRDVKINLAGPGVAGPTGVLGLRVALDADDGLKRKLTADAGANADKKGTKVKAAKEYLSKHGLESKLSEAMSAVLRERPSDPAAFLAKQLQEPSVKLPPVSGAGGAGEEALPMGGKPLAYQEEKEGAAEAPNKQARPGKLAPLPDTAAAAAKTSEPLPVSILPFNSYYNQNMRQVGPAAFASIYARFPPPKKEEAGAQPQPQPQLGKDPFQAYYAANVITSSTTPLTDIYSKFPAATRTGPPAAESSKATTTEGFEKMPSVGSWLALSPRSKGQAMAAPASIKGADFRSVPPASWEAVHGRFEAAKAAPPAAAPAAAPAAVSQGTFAFRPSVGTWLMKAKGAQAPPPVAATSAPVAAPAAAATQGLTKRDEVADFKMAVVQIMPPAAPAAGAAPFRTLPSVGTWVQPLPRFIAQAAPAAVKSAPAPASAPAAVGRPATFAATPSVGTWLGCLRNQAPAITLSYCLQGLRPPQTASQEELQEVERVVTKALLQLSGECAGTYLPLASSWSYAPRPGGMSADDADALRKAGLLLPSAGDPQSRGVFAPPALAGTAVWINPSAKYHVQLVAASKDESVKLEQLAGAVRAALEKEGSSLTA
jgi:hypothetical protein